MGGNDEHLTKLAESAALAPRHDIEPFFKETAKEVLVALARNPNLQEPDLLRLLERKDLPAEVIREIATHAEASRHYTVKLAIVRHPRTPRRISLPILKFLYLFDLVRVTQTPAVPADVKRAAEEAVLTKVGAVSQSEKMTLARRASGRVASGLIAAGDRELIGAALDNPFLTEADLLRVLAVESMLPVVIELIARHDKWSCRYHVRLALIRNPMTPLTRVLNFMPDVAVNDLREICLDRRMPEQVRWYVLAFCAARSGEKRPNRQRASP
jgi:hypothetical protein